MRQFRMWTDGFKNGDTRKAANDKNYTDNPYPVPKPVYKWGSNYVGTFQEKYISTVSLSHPAQITITKRQRNGDVR